jgi:hypothetical protein
MMQFTDTDSLCYEINTEDIFKDRAQNPELFDFSNYPKDHKYYSNSVVGLFKVEGRQILEFVGLRSKMYSILFDDDGEKKTAKGIKKCVINNYIRHADYVLDEMTTMNVSMRMFRSRQHQIYSIDVLKKGLSCFDNKQYLYDSIYSL